MGKAEAFWLQPTVMNCDLFTIKTLNKQFNKGMYPQSDGSLAIVNIDASKGFVDLWVHLSFAILLFSM